MRVVRSPSRPEQGNRKVGSPMDGRYSGGLPKNFLQPCLLLLVLEQPGYGYDLVARLKPLGINDDAASVYRALRLLEHDGAVTSSWKTSETGPARRGYPLTPAGEKGVGGGGGGPGGR